MPSPERIISLQERLDQHRQQQEQGSVARVYEAYRSGRMTPEDEAAFEADVFNGRIMLPRDATLKRMPDPPLLSQTLIDAYNSHRMTPEDRALVDREIAAGRASLPEGAVLQAPPARAGAELAGSLFGIELAAVFVLILGAVAFWKLPHFRPAIWPKYTKIGATPGVRIGRLLHWCGLGLGAVLLFVEISEGQSGFLFGFIGFAICALAGRALRYLFAGE